MKKAQIMGMPIILIFGLIAGALILIWGITKVYDLNDMSDSAQIADTITELKNTMDVFSNYDDGATKKYMIDFPSKVEQVCFYNPDEQFNCILDKSSCPQQLNEDMDVIVSNTYNIYIYPLEYDITAFKVDLLIPKNGNPLCITNKKTAILEKTKESIEISYYEKSTG